MIAVSSDDRPQPPAPSTPRDPGAAGGHLPIGQVPLDRAALERVLARAVELQAADTEAGEPILTEDQLLEIGKEVGIAPHHLRQALAEERTHVRAPEESGLVARVFGPAVVTATRTIPGTPESVLAALDLWMQREECLQVKRLFPDRILWERRSGFLNDLKRGLNIGGRGYHLSRAHEVSGTVVAVDRERVLVRLEANLANIRTGAVAWGSVLGATGLIGAGVLLAVGFIPAAALLPAVTGLGGGYAVARSHAPAVARAQLALEQVLDRLERGEAPRPPLLGALSTIRVIR